MQNSNPLRLHTVHTHRVHDPQVKADIRGREINSRFSFAPRRVGLPVRPVAVHPLTTLVRGESRLHGSRHSTSPFVSTDHPTHSLRLRRRHLKILTVGRTQQQPGKAQTSARPHPATRTHKNWLSGVVSPQSRAAASEQMGDNFNNKQLLLNSNAHLAYYSA